MNATDRFFRLARIWSNDQLRQIAQLITGSVVNVSAGTDEDKEGHHYRSYFSGATEYQITNWNPGSFRGHTGRPGEILLDLERPLPEHLRGQYDAVFNHTTLEHVYAVTTAFSNLCLLSKDLVVLVVPFAQVHHENTGYQDFWRFTPTCIRRMFADNGFEVLYESVSPYPNCAVYLFYVASCNPEHWFGAFPAIEARTAGDWIGRPSKGPVDILAGRIRRLVTAVARLFRPGI